MGGSDVQVWNAGGRAVPDIIAGNVSQHAGNIRWQLIGCQNQPGTYYIVNPRHGMFLVARGKEHETLDVWNDGGKHVETIIQENINEGDIRWIVIPVDRASGGYRHQENCAPVKEAAVPSLLALQPLQTVRIVHLSDTHNMHRAIEAKFPLPEGDILIHTGDFSDNGSPAEIADFDAWLGEIGQRFRHVLLIPGNHDWWHTVRKDVTNRALDPYVAVSRNFMQRKFRNCRTLINEEIIV